MEAKQKGLPWTVSKGYDTFTPIGPRISSNLIKNVNSLNLKLYVDGHLRQDGDVKDMVFGIPKLVEYISGIMTLEKGDIILTGTPEGVGPVSDGQVIEGVLSDQGRVISEIEFNVIDRV